MVMLGYVGIMENKMETTVIQALHWDYLGRGFRQTLAQDRSQRKLFFPGPAPLPGHDAHVYLCVCVSAVILVNLTPIA